MEDQETLPCDVEVCSCKKHARIVLGDREGFSPEFASFSMGVIFLNAVCDGMCDHVLRDVFLKIQGLGLPIKESDVDSETRGLVENWNILYLQSDDDEPSLDPREFHKIATCAIVTDTRGISN